MRELIDLTGQLFGRLRVMVRRASLDGRSRMTQPIVSLVREFTFDAAHRITNHWGKCRSLHGHHWVTTVVLRGPVEPATGMVVDFSTVKALCGALFDEWDHSVLLHKDDPLVAACEAIYSRMHVFDFEPTSENLAVYAFDWIACEMSRLVGVQHVTLTSVTIRETVACSAMYTGEYGGEDGTA